MAATLTAAAAQVGIAGTLHTSQTTQKPSKKISAAAPLRSPAFHGVADKKDGFFGGALPVTSGKSRSTTARRAQLKVEARTAGAVKQIEVEVDKPLGLELGQKSNGVVTITSVAKGGNSDKAGLKVGDQVVYTSSFFGDELWPADKLGFTTTAIRAKADSVYFVVARGGEVDTKRLPKRPAPPRFGRKLTAAQKERATHICLDCGYIYTLPKPFADQPEGYECPQCSAPKKRFANYDAETGRVSGGGTPVVVLVTLLLGLAAVGAGVFYGLQ